MSHILYYGFYTGLASGCGMGILYYFDKELASNIAGHFSWNMVKLYHYLNSKCNKTRKRCTEQVSSVLKSNKSEIIHKVKFIGYNHKNNNTYNTIDLSNEYIYDNSFDIMLLEYKNKFKRILSKDDIKYHTIDSLKNIFDSENVKIFLQVQLDQLNTKTDIHEHLSKFYLNDNILLDTVFLQWYLYKFYNIIISKDYKINIIDNNINIFNISNTESTLIKKENTKYYYEIRNDII
jgi:hypothetical protein